MAGSLPSSSSNFHLNWAIGAWHGQRLALHCRRQATTSQSWLQRNLLTGQTGDSQATRNKWNACKHLAGSLNKALRDSRGKTLILSDTPLHSQSPFGLGSCCHLNNRWQHGALDFFVCWLVIPRDLCSSKIKLLLPRCRCPAGYMPQNFSSNWAGSPSTERPTVFNFICWFKPSVSSSLKTSQALMSLDYFLLLLLCCTFF